MRAAISRGLRLFVLVLAVPVLGSDARAGGLPAVVNLPAEWMRVAPGPGAEIVEFFQRLPHDPTTLGVGPAHPRTGDHSTCGERWGAADGGSRGPLDTADPTLQYPGHGRFSAGSPGPENAHPWTRERMPGA
jgi:hypothetical protein